MKVIKPLSVIPVFLFLCFMLINLGVSVSNAQESKHTLNANSDLTPVKLQLKWQHQFQFAGYYAAIEQGFYQQAGLDVTLIEPQIGTDPIQTVLNGQADFGVGTSEILLHYHQGAPLVVLAAIMQHSPLALAALSQHGVTNIHQLAAAPMMVEPNSLELLGYLKKEGVDIRQLQLVEHNFVVDDLLSGQVKSQSVYITDEPYLFAQKGLAMQYFQPIMAGIDFYGDNLFTSKTLLKQNPDLVEAFRQASLKGWAYAMDHPQQIVELIYSHYSQRKTRENLLFEAEKMRELMRPDLVELGYMNPGRWQHIAQVYAEMGLLPPQIELDGLLYQTPDIAYQKLKRQFYYAGLLILFIAALAALFYRQYHLANVSKKRFQALFLNAPISLIEIEPQGKILHWNRQAERTFNYPAQEAIGQNVFDLLVDQADIPAIKAVVTQAYEQNKITQSENDNHCKNGETLLCQWTNMPFNSDLKQNKRILCMARDITQEKHMADQLYRAAHYDSLTGLPNRRLMLDLLKQAISQASKQHTALAILFIDLNGFKAINDNHGHQVGDDVLKIVAQRIPEVLQRGDLFGRLSGDEFLVVIRSDGDSNDIQTQIEKIRHNLQQPMQTNHLTLQISASIGLSRYPQDAQDIEQLVRIADQSMYKVKAQHKTHTTE